MDNLTDRERDVLRQALHEWVRVSSWAEHPREFLGDCPRGLAESTARDLLARLSYARA